MDKASCIALGCILAVCVIGYFVGTRRVGMKKHDKQSTKFSRYYHAYKGEMVIMLVAACSVIPLFGLTAWLSISGHDRIADGIAALGVSALALAVAMVLILAKAYDDPRDWGGEDV